jgi:hypothetical protein
VEIAGQPLDVGQGDFAGPGRDMSVCVKTHDIELVADGTADGGNVLKGVVRSQAYLGSQRDYIVGLSDPAPEGTPGQELLVAAPASFDVPAGSKVGVKFRADRCRGLVR